MILPGLQTAVILLSAILLLVAGGIFGRKINRMEEEEESRHKAGQNGVENKGLE